MMAPSQLRTLEGAVPLSQALPEGPEGLKAGMEFAVLGIMITPKEKLVGGVKIEWDTVNLNVIMLPDGTENISLKSSAGAVVRKMKDLRSAYCYNTGATKHPVRVRVVTVEGPNGPYLDLVDA